MINRECPLCHTTADPFEQGSLYRLSDQLGHTYYIVACARCGHVFTWFNEDVNVDAFYDDLDYTIRDTRKTLFYTIQRLEYTRVIRQLKKTSKQKALTLLDFGCGKGVFLSFAKKYGLQVKGVETSGPRSDFARKVFGIEVNTDYYTSGRIFPEEFDTLTLFHVIEHLSDPRALLNNLVKDNLKQGGVLIIETPNFSSWQSKWSKDRWLQLDVPRHLSHFTRSSLRQLVEASGCRIVHKQFFSFHLGILSMSQTIMSSLGYKGFLMGDLKKKPSVGLLLFLAVVLPFAVLLELIASIAGKGDVIRYYAIKK